MSAATEKVDEFAGMTSTKCPNACTKRKCIISTVRVCKHPVIAPMNGCGPKTMANRERAAKYIKRQQIEKE